MEEGTRWDLIYEGGGYVEDNQTRDLTDIGGRYVENDSGGNPKYNTSDVGTHRTVLIWFRSTSEVYKLRTRRKRIPPT